MTQLPALPSKEQLLADIAHAEEKATTLCGPCAIDHARLAYWLRALLAGMEQKPVAYDQQQRDLMNSIVATAMKNNLERGDKLVMADVFAATMALMQAGFRTHPAPPISASGWIKCSDRMPEDEQEVLTINRMGHQFVSFFDEHSGLFFDRLDAPATECVEHILVTHWMPLPNVPQPEGD